MDGTNLFIKYAFAPNKLRFCGPSDNRTIFQYFKSSQSDKGLIELLCKFEGAYPYLEYIAWVNKIPNPFDYRVVESYWIGNELLENVSMNGFYDYLKNRFKGQWKKNSLEKVFAQNRIGAKPHHSFHVVSTLARKKVNQKILDHVGDCLIQFGKIIEIKNRVVVVEYDRFVFDNQFKKITSQKKLINNIGDIDFIVDLKKEDIVSFHWGRVCDKLNDRQIKLLDNWNNYHLNMFLDRSILG